MLALLISVVAAFGFALLHERATQVGCGLIMFATQFLPQRIAEARRDQWLADIHEVEGGAWKLVTAVGIVWTCRLAIIEGVTGVRLKKKYMVVLLPTSGEPFSVMFYTKHVNPCGFIVLGVIYSQLVNLVGEEEARRLLTTWTEEREMQKGRRVVSSDVAFQTHVAPLNLNVLIEMVNGEPQIRSVG